MPLTRRESEILGLLAEGLSNDEIAARLVISPNTVKVHLRNVFEKMGVQSRTEAAMEAVRRGWIAAPGAASPPETVSTVVIEPPSWPPLAWVWQPWRTVVLVAALALAVLMAVWPNLSPAVVTPLAPDFTSDLGNASTTPLPRQEVARWSQRAPMPTARSRSGAAVIDGRWYVVGGETASGDTAALEVYDATFDTWQSLPPRPVAARHAGVAAMGSSLYAVGGCAGAKPLPDVDRFDVSAQSWRNDASPRVAPLPVARCGVALAAHDGRLFAFGGWDGERVQDSVFMFDAAANRWIELAPMPEPRAFAAVVGLRDRLYLLGGYDGARDRAEMWEYAPAADSWTPLPPLTEPRAGLAVAAEGNSIYAFGGGQRMEEHVHERFDLNTLAWSTIDSPRSGPWHHAVAVIIGPNLHIAGGWAGDYLPSQESYQVSHLLFLPLGAQGAK